MRSNHHRLSAEEALIDRARTRHLQYAAAKKVAQPCSQEDHTTAAHGQPCPNCGYDGRLTDKELEATL